MFPLYKLVVFFLSKSRLLVLAPFDESLTISSIFLIKVLSPSLAPFDESHSCHLSYVDIFCMEELYSSIYLSAYFYELVDLILASEFYSVASIILF